MNNWEAGQIMEFENILKLIESVSKSSLTGFTLEEGGTKIVLEANRGTVQAVNTTVNGVQVSVPASNATQETGTLDLIVGNNGIYEGKVVKSPLVGVFYSAPSPDADEFVKVGDRVSVGQTLGIVEAMKLMNEIECEFEGTVTQILIGNEEIVEYGQPLFVIE